MVRALKERKSFHVFFKAIAHSNIEKHTKNILVKSEAYAGKRYKETRAIVPRCLPANIL